MKFFSAEADIAHLLNEGRVSLASTAESVDQFPVKELVLASNPGNPGQIDLHYLRSILVSTGWNKNDDIFHPHELWMAKNTPEDKPFNYEHDCNDIIGHITDNYVMGDDGHVVANTMPIDEIPGRFHIVTNAVLYKMWPDEEKQKRMDKIVAELGSGSWFVSMECLFNHFDYGCLMADGSHKVIERNASTAFLTKHLKAYGGDGTYQDMRIGRLLRNIVFCGKGLVRTPANPSSVIVAGKTNENIKEIDFSKSHLVYEISEVKKMDSEKLQAENVELKAKVEKLEATLVDRVAELKAKGEEIANLADAVKKAEDALTKVEAELKKVADAKKKAERLSLARTELGLDEGDALEMVENTFVLTDEAFAKAVQIQAKKMKSVTAATPTEVIKAAEVQKDASMAVADEKVESQIQKLQAAVNQLMGVK